MENNENLVADISNENADPFSEMTPEEEAEEEEGEGEAEEEERDAEQTELPSETIIPTTMLTPPPTGEPLLNGSSQSSTSGNDLQQFTADDSTQQSSVESHHSDEGNSNQSANSDSIDTKLIINEGSVDSSDISNTIDGKTVEPSIDVHSVVDSDGITTLPIVIDSNQTDETLDVRNEQSHPVAHDEDVIEQPIVEPIVESASRDADENDADLNAQQHESLDDHAVENVKNVPSSQSINGIVCPDNDESTSAIDYDTENRLANETHTEHRKLKRKLSDSLSDPYETSAKHTKLNNNQINSLGLSDNQIVLDDSISNHLVNYDQIADGCDEPTNDDVQTATSVEDEQPTVLEKSQENADENFESELVIDDDDDDEVDDDHHNNDKDDDRDDLLPVTKEKSIDECDHIYMNGHTSQSHSNTESILTIDAPHEEEYNQQQQQQEQLTFKPKNDLDDSIQSHALKSKIKNPFSTPPQSETNSTCDNSDERSLDVQPTENQLEINSQSDLLAEQPSETITNLSTELTSNLKQIPINHGIISSTTTTVATTVMAMNISTNSDSNGASFANAFSGNKNVDVSCAPTNFEHPKATTIAPSQTQYDNGKKINTHIRIRRQVFLCSACGTYYEKWNLFYHIREVHNKFICLFCLGIFPNAERLVNHLESKHVHKPFIYEHKDDLIKSLRNQCFLTCCVCEHIFTENDDVAAHSCETFMKPCTVCGLKFIHKSNCKALLSNKSSKHKQKRTTAASNTVQQMMPNTTPPAMVGQTPMTTTIGNSGNGVSQQTFLRNALLGQANEPRVNQYGDYQSTPIIAQMPMFDRRLNNVQPHRNQSQPQPHPHSLPHPHPQSHLQSQPHPQSQSQFQPQSHLQLQPQHHQHHHQQHHQVIPESILSMNAINGGATQQTLVSKLHMNTPEVPSNFYNANMLPIHNAEMYHANHVPYMNLPNGQYTQNPLDSRYAAPNPSFGKTLDASTKPAFNTDRQEKSQNKDNNNSNSDSSSDSDDSNNDSDSSSDTDAEKEDKENSSKRVVKPFRLNLNKNNMIERRDSPYVDEQNESAPEDDSIDNETGMANSLTDNNRSHHNMSDITNIQRQLDNIKQHLSEMQRVEEPEPSLKVPKLTLKLTKPFQNPVESEQSSTESDSESENDDDEENVSHEQHDSNAPIDVESSEKVVNLEQPSFLQTDAEAVHQYPYNTNASDCLSNTIGNNNNNNNGFDDSLNESGSSDKNTSMESDDKSEGVTENAEYQAQSQPQLSAPAQGELPMNCESDQMQPQPEIQPVAEPTANLEQTNIALDNQTNINDNFYPTTLEHNQNVMTPPDSILDGQGETESQTGGITVAPDLNSESNEQEHIDVDTPQVIEDKRPITEFILDQPLDKIPIKHFIRKCLQFTYPNCLYCNHARSIAVSGVSLAEHLIGEHRFSATVDSITAEELLPETIEQKITTGLDELAETYFNMESYDNKIVDSNYQYVKHFECFQCRFHSPIYKDLYLHNRKMHLRSALICLMCRSNFYSYSELVCHMCPGAQTKLIPIDLKFRCVLCNLDDIPSAFRLMVHLRKKHSACDVCLEECIDQNKLSSHVWKHKLHHLCYRCNITYRNKADITRHLFWKHGTESVLCKRCLEKKWPHVYHFCTPSASFKCEICNSTFSKALTLKVHKRSHDPESISFPCSLDDCDQKFISKKLMIKHVSLHYMPELPPPSEEKNLLRENDENESLIDKEGTGLQANSPSNSPSRNSPERIEQEAPIDAVISVIEHDAREQEEKEKQLKKESTGRNESSNEQGHKNKSRKLKKNRSDFSDLLDLPSVNLSESDSSEDSDAESNTPHDPSAENSRHSLSAASGTTEMVTKVKSAPPALDDDDEKAVMLEADIWENFKTYQASVSMQDKSLDSEEEEQVIAENPVLLHVSQSDHDYPMMYKPLVKKQKIPSAETATSSFAPIIEEDERGNIKITLIEATESIADNLDPQSPAPLPTSTVTITDEEIPKTEDENIVDDTNEQLDTDKKDAKKSKADKSDRKADDSDSSSDSSDSDSSCSCGSNCSCSSSSSSSDSSSSDSGSNSSSSEGRRKKLLTKAARTPERTTTPEKKVETAEIEQKPEPVNEEIPDAPTISPKIEADEKTEETVADESETIDVGKPEPVDVDVVDVVTTDKKFTQPDIYTIILESDLETTESETDEEFYDEHPQKLAIQMLAEKRQQLMSQTLNPVNGMPYMSTSRPATPLLPEEQSRGPKTKTKKRRRTHKNSRSPQKQPSKNVARFNPNGLHHTPNNLSLIEKPLDTVIASQQAMTTASATIPESTPFTMQSNPFMRSMIDASPQINSNPNVLAASVASTPVTSKYNDLHSTPATLPSKHHLMRLSTSSASDADSSLKRSKRRRIPNKFYGYTSDDEGMSAASALNTSYQNPFKPTPPPNLNKWRESLTWSKEDLPKPSKNNRTGTLKKIMRLSSTGKMPKQQRKLPLKGAMKTTGIKNRTLAKIKEKMRLTTTPTVPKIIIRGIPRPNPPKVMAPDLSDASRIPNAPVHRMSPPLKLNNEQSDESSDSDSDSNLHINQTMSRNNFGAHSGDNGDKVMRAQPPKQQMPFIRPDHTLLPPKRFSLSPSPPPTSTSTSINEHQSTQIERLPSNLLSTAMQQPIFNGLQHKAKTQDNARNDNNLYCYCLRPYDEGSEMIACDGQDCSIEWFHFECVGIVKGTTINPQDKWYCPKCKEQNMAQNRYAMQPSNNVNNTNANRFTSTSLDLA